MIPKSGNRFSDKIMREESMIPKSGNRFPACAKHSQSRILPFEASAGEARSDKIMREESMIPKNGKRLSDKITREQRSRKRRDYTYSDRAVK